MKYLIKKLLREGLMSESEYFNLKTSAQDYDNLLAKNYDAVPEKFKRYEASIEYMTMEEYIKEVANIQHTSYEEQFKYISKENVNKIMGGMSSGVKYNIGYLNYIDREQEGRHRVVAASKLGLNKIPVLIIDWGPEGPKVEDESFKKSYDLNNIDDLLEFYRLFPDEFDEFLDDPISSFVHGSTYISLKDDNFNFSSARNARYRKANMSIYLPEVYWDKPFKQLQDLILKEFNKKPDKVEYAIDAHELTNTKLELENLFTLLTELEPYMPELFAYVERLIHGVSKYMAEKHNSYLIETNEQGVKIEIGSDGIANVYSEGGKGAIKKHYFGFVDNEYFYGVDEELSTSIGVEWMKLYPFNG